MKRFSRRSVVTAGLVALTVLTGPPSRGQSASPLFDTPVTGPLVVVGGGLTETNEPVFRAMLSFRVADLPICVLPTTRDAESEMEGAIDALSRYGGPGAATPMPQLFTRPGRADKEKYSRSLEACGGFLFLGGDPSNVIRTLRPDGRSTLAEQAILRVHRRGGVIAGTSPAATMMSDTMLVSGSSDDALSYGITNESGKRGLWLQAGLGFFHDALIDGYRRSEGGAGRLIVALAGLDGVDRGFGIDDETALVINGTRTRVVGDSQVIVLEKVRPGTGPNHLDGARFRLLLLGNGDEYDLQAGTASVEAGKESLRLEDVVPTPPTGPWVADGLPLFLVDLAVSAVDTGQFESNGYIFLLTKESGFDARAWELPDRQHIPHGFTAGWFVLDLSRETKASGDR